MTNQPYQLTQLGALSANAVQLIRHRQKHPELYRPLKFGIPALEEVIGGIVLPSYVAIGGSQKRGKTTLATKIAKELTDVKGGINDQRVVSVGDKEPKPLKVLYFHLEEVSFQFAVRMMTMITPTVTRTQIRDLTLTDNDIIELENASAELQPNQLFMADSIYTADQMIQMALDFEAQILIADTFNLLEDKTGDSDEAKRLAAVSRKFLKARNLHGLTSLIVYQLNDVGKSFGTRALGKDADLILELHGAKDANKRNIDGQLSIKVLPSRQSAGTGSNPIRVLFSGAKNTIEPLNTNTFDFKEVAEQMGTPPSTGE